MRSSVADCTIPADIFVPQCEGLRLQINTFALTAAGKGRMHRVAYFRFGFSPDLKLLLAEMKVLLGLLIANGGSFQGPFCCDFSLLTSLLRVGIAEVSLPLQSGQGNIGRGE